MIDIDVPGYKKLSLENLVLDFNGTLAVDGIPVRGVEQTLKTLSRDLSIYVVTADTFGKAAEALKNVPMELTVLPKKNQAFGKLAILEELGAEKTVAMGNGNNDGLMLEAAALGIAVVLEEGAFVKTLMKADVVTTSIIDALELLLNPLRLTATLRS